MNALKSGGNSSAKQRRLRLLKIWLTAFAAVGLCVWAVYRCFFNHPSEYADDFTVKSAIAWLKNADAGKFDVCRKNIVDGDWFTWFEKDRTSLEKNGRRELFQRLEISGASPGMKRYELKFDTRFTMFKNPKSLVTERVLIESDGREKYQVLMADYFLRRAFEKPINRNPAGAERDAIVAQARKIMEQAESGNMDFFKQAYLARMKDPDYFGWKKYMVIESRNQKNLKDIYNLLKNSQTSPKKLVGVGIWSPRGRTGFEEATVRYEFSVNKENRKKEYILIIGVSRDFYQDKSAPWNFDYIFGTEKKEKK